MLTEKQVEIASGTIARVIEEKAAKGDSADALGKAAEATAQALVKGFNVINQPAQTTEIVMVVTMDNPTAQEKTLQKRLCEAIDEFCSKGFFANSGIRR